MQAKSGTILAFKATRPQLGKDVLVTEGARIIGDVHCGDESSIWFNAVVRGDVHYIRIGARTNVQDNAVIHVTSGVAPTVIGEDVTIGHGALVHACNIGNRVLIGMGAIILDQATIADDTVVGAGALVPPGKSFPSGVLLVGSPAKVARQLTEKERLGLKKSASHYVQLSKEYLCTNTGES